VHTNIEAHTFDVLVNISYATLKLLMIVFVCIDQIIVVW